MRKHIFSIEHKFLVLMDMFGFEGCVISFEKVVSFCKHQIVFWLFHLLLWSYSVSCFEKVNSDWKNVPKQSRKTVVKLQYCIVLWRHTLQKYRNGCCQECKYSEIQYGTLTVKASKVSLRTVRTIDAIVWRLRFGWTLWPASLTSTTTPSLSSS